MDQLGRWYFTPLGDMKGHQAFIAMILSIVLLEKWLRVSCGFGEQEFSQGSKPIGTIADYFSIDPQFAYEFWQDWRNGLLHRATPKVEHFTGYTMSGTFSRGIEVHDGHIYINPWRFRDEVLKLIQKDRDLWKDDQCPLAKEFTVFDDLK